MRVNIKGGTANGNDPSLCVTCRHATIVKGPSAGDEIVECDRLYTSKRISFKVVSCSEYADRRQASLREMEEIAWVLRSDLKKGVIGFVKASALKPRERFVLPDDWD
jgi:hypothetical protein